MIISHTNGIFAQSATPTSALAFRERQRVLKHLYMNGNDVEAGVEVGESHIREGERWIFFFSRNII